MFHDARVYKDVKLDNKIQLSSQTNSSWKVIWMQESIQQNQNNITEP